MKIIKQVEKKVDEVIEVICDSCGNPCMTEYGNNSISIEKYWGFSSNKDLEHWTADVCEKCVDEKLSFIHFYKRPYNPF